MKSYNSIEDLKVKFKQEYPDDQLISIPVVKLQNYRSVPVHLTEDDIRENIKQEEEEIVQERIAFIRSKKQDVLDILKHFDSHKRIETTAKALNDLLFETIFTGEKDCACQSCQAKSCTHTSSKKCKVNKGQKTEERAKQGLKYKWEEAVRSMQSSQLDQNFDKIEEFTIKELKIGI